MNTITETNDMPKARVSVMTSAGPRLVKPRSGNDPHQIDFPLSIQTKRPGDTSQISVKYDPATLHWDVAAYLPSGAGAMPAAHALDFVSNLIRAARLADSMNAGKK